MVTVAATAGWLYQTMTIRLERGSEALRWSELTAALEKERTRPQNTVIPSSYTLGHSFEDTAIRFNGLGWDSGTGKTTACVALFVKDPECLTIDLAPTEGANLPIAEYHRIQARIGLESLRRTRCVPTPEGVRILFQGPTTAAYRRGVQLLSLGMMAPSELTDGHSRFRLLEVSWRDEPDSTKYP